MSFAIARAEVIGSMLRPDGLKQVRARHAAGELDTAELTRIEDAAIAEAIAVQERAGVAVVTDGELRRRETPRQGAQRRTIPRGRTDGAFDAVRIRPPCSKATPSRGRARRPSFASSRTLPSAFGAEPGVAIGDRVALD